MPNKAQPCPEWPLSPTGERQAEQLAELLAPLTIDDVFSSPYVRSLDTARPFTRKGGLQVTVVEDLRERLITCAGELPSDEVWCRSWQDFSFALPGCETSLAAQARMYQAICQIAQKAKGTSAVFTHGNVIGLFLNAVTSNAGRSEAEALRNPDVLRVEWREGLFTWDRDFCLTGLKEFATAHWQTPRNIDLDAPNPTAMGPFLAKRGGNDSFCA